MIVTHAYCILRTLIYFYSLCAVRFSVSNEQFANPIYMTPGHRMEPSKSSTSYDNPSYMSHVPTPPPSADDNTYSTVAASHTHGPSFIVTDDKSSLVDNMEH